MPGIEEFTAWYGNLPQAAQIGIPAVGVGAVALIALKGKGGNAPAGQYVSGGASYGGSGPVSIGTPGGGTSGGTTSPGSPGTPGTTPAPGGNGASAPGPTLPGNAPGPATQPGLGPYTGPSAGQFSAAKPYLPGYNELAGAPAEVANAYWMQQNDLLKGMQPGANVGSIFPSAARVPNSASPETQATASEYQNLVLGSVNTPGSTNYGKPVDVQKGLTANDIQAQINYLQGIQKAGAYNPNLAEISSQQAVSSLIASEQAALASGAYGTATNTPAQQAQAMLLGGTTAGTSAASKPGPTNPGSTAPALTLSEFNAQYRAATIARNPNADTKQINAQIAANYAKYEAAHA